jgi:enterochelin esterase-like enzyme
MPTRRANPSTQPLSATSSTRGIAVVPAARRSRIAPYAMSSPAVAPKRYWIACSREDFLFEGVTELLALYDEVGFDYTYRESEGGHSWNNWRLYLSEFAPMLFKD